MSLKLVNWAKPSTCDKHTNKSRLKIWVQWSALCNQGIERSTGAAFFNQPLQRAPMQIVSKAFFNLRLIYSLCQAHVENTSGQYTWFITHAHVLPTKQPHSPPKNNKNNNLAYVLQHNSGLYYELQLPLWYRCCSTFICSSGDGRLRWQNDYYSPNNRFCMLSLLSALLLRLKHIKEMKQNKKKE